MIDQRNATRRLMTIAVVSAGCVPATA